MADRDITFRLRADTSDLDAKLDEAKANFTETGQASHKLFDETTQNNLSRFSQGVRDTSGYLQDTTRETGLLDRAVGGATSRMTSMAITLGVGALLGALTAAYKAMDDWVNGPLRAAEQAMTDASNAALTLADSIDQAMDARMRQARGLSTYDEKRLEIGRQLTALDQQRLKLEEEVQANFAAKTGQVLPFESAQLQALLDQDEAYQANKRAVDALVKSLERLKATETALPDEPALVPITRTKAERARDKENGSPYGAEDYGPTREMYEDAENEAFLQGLADKDQAQRAANAAIEEEKRRSAAVQLEIERWKNERILDAEAEALQERIQDEEEFIRQREASMAANEKMIGQFAQGARAVSGIYEMLAVGTAKSEKERLKAQAYSRGVYAAIETVVQIAEAASDFAAENYVQGALHVIAAAEWAVASGMAFKEAGGGGGGAAAPKAPGAGDKEYWSQRKDEGSTGGITINIGGDVISGHSAGELFLDLAEEARRRRNPTQPVDGIEV